MQKLWKSLWKSLWKKIYFSLDNFHISRGKYESGRYHAEIDAIENYKGHLPSDAIIYVTSPPCPCCAVLLECMNLSSRVYTIGNKCSRVGESAIVPIGYFSRSNKFDLLLPADISREGLSGKEERIIQFFLAKGWMRDNDITTYGNSWRY